MHAATKGEHLFYYLRNSVLPQFRSGGVSWPSLNSLLSISGQRNDLSDYVTGAVSILLMKKLIRFAESVNESGVPEHMLTKKIVGYIKHDLELTLGADVESKLARMVAQAANVSGKSIPPSIRADVLGLNNVHCCYLCDQRLDAGQSVSGAVDFLTLEHVWPSSLGGDSEATNLLPACTKCQQKKADSMSWEWLNVYNLVLPENPSTEALKSIPWATRISLHYKRAMQLALDDKMSLKNAFRKIGPIGEVGVTPSYGPVTYFDLNTVDA